MRFYVRKGKDVIKEKQAPRENPGMEIYYWKNEQQWEIDFVIREALEITQLIQVCWDLSDPRVRQREIRALAKGFEIFGLTEGVVVTSEEEGMEKINGKKIHLVPLFHWLAS